MKRVYRDLIALRQAYFTQYVAEWRAFVDKVSPRSVDSPSGALQLARAQ